MIHVPTSPAAHFPFDVLAWICGLSTGAWIKKWRTELVSVPVSNGYYTALAAGAIVGAWLAGSANTLRAAAPSLSHSVVGALAGAIVAVELFKFATGMRRSTGGPFVAALTVGIVVGRWGCFFAGLPDQTFGTPTSLPWGVDLGDHVSRHPVQLYESLSMAVFLIVYIAALAKQHDWALRRGLYVFCIWYGAQRFCWEWLKPYPKIAGPFNLFHIICLGLVIYGSCLYRRDLRDQRAQERAVFVPGPDHQPV
jgi:phosphatidylglycerol:prolipoprotein diacylglycerol transferase